MSELVKEYDRGYYDDILGLVRVAFGACIEIKISKFLTSHFVIDSR